MDAEHIRKTVGSLKEYYATKPEKAIGTDTFAMASLTDGLAVSVEGPSGQSVASDMPKGVGGGAGAPTPGWYVRAGIASCTATVIALRAAELSVSVQRLTVKVESRSNDHGMLGSEDGVPPGPLEATMSVEIASEGTPRETLLEIVDWGVAHSPMADGLTRAVPLSVEVTVI